MMKMQPTIETHNLRKYFGTIQALNNLNLQDGGTISGFIGPNGAGKTTTLHILLGFIKPSQGNATVFGLDTWNQSLKIREKVGFLQEKPHYPTAFTGQRFLEHIAKFHNLSQPRQKANQILKEVDLASASEKQIKTYSAGMLQRLGLAQALVSEPELVILDEPTANLDPTGRLDLLEKIEQLQKDKSIKFFVSTHILSELEKVCNWVSIINYGTIVDQGYMQDLTAKYSACIYKITVTKPHNLLEALENQPYIEKAWQEENDVLAQVKDTEAFLQGISQITAQQKMKIKELRSMYSALEEIYDVAVRRKKE
jgi:ABC-2 type transport system ATP-binding protein